MSDSTPPISYSFESSTYPQVFTVSKAPRRPYWLHALLLLLTWRFYFHRSGDFAEEL